MESFEHLEGDDRLKAENEFMKMKMMLEKGAEFYTEKEGAELPAELENMFLSNIMEFERQFEQHRTVKIFDKIGRPTHFKPVAQVQDHEIMDAWKKLSEHLQQHGITLDACSPNVTKRELYRFTLEELFDYEITDMNIPGMMQGFIYDEFHPDHIYDNTRLATDHGIKQLLSKKPLEHLFPFRRENLRLNNHYPVSEGQFKALVNQFKAAYDEIGEAEITGVSCMIDKEICLVKGEYKVTVTLSGESIQLSGKWLTEFKLEKELGYWYIHTILVEGIQF
jgi:hypothetical protein